MHDRTSSATAHSERIAYKPDEVAGRLGVSKRHVYRLINKGEIQVVTLGGRWMVLAEELDAFVERLKAGAAA